MTDLDRLQEKLGQVESEKDRKRRLCKQIFIRLASLGGGPQAHVHMEGKKCRVLFKSIRHECSVFVNLRPLLLRIQAERVGGEGGREQRGVD